MMLSRLVDSRGLDSAESEALQADVMRFVAIIGLCLAAIFSLLPNPEATSVSAGEDAGKPVTVAAGRTAPVLVPDPAPVPRPESATELEPVAADAGFSLSFESAEALQVLLEGGIVTLFATSEAGSWRYRAERDLFTMVPAPRHYYRMETATVPAALRSWLEAAGVSVIEWGVVLPATLARELQELMRGRRSGELRIQASGEVKLVAPVP